MAKILGIEIEQKEDGTLEMKDVKEFGAKREHPLGLNDEDVEAIKRANRVGFYAAPVKMAEHFRRQHLSDIKKVIALTEMANMLGDAVGDDHLQSTEEIEAMKELVEKLEEALDEFVAGVKALAAEHGYTDLKKTMAEALKKAEGARERIEGKGKDKDKDDDPAKNVDADGNVYKIV